jgi:tight adherence protein B
VTIVVSLLFGAGVLLVASPFLWPRTSRRGPSSRSVVGSLRERLAAAGLDRVGPAAFLVLSGLAAVAAAAVAEALTGVAAVSLAAGIAGAALPWLVVSWRARSRRRSGRALWPDIVDHLIASVRSGLALPDAVSSLARLGPVETRAAFAEFERDYRATGTFSPCVDRLKQRLADPVADRVLETLRMARDVGGTQLTTVLGSLAASLRQSAAVRSEVEARQSWVVNAARLGVAAPWIVLLLLTSRGEAAAAYNTAAGGVVIVAGLVVSVIAYRLMVALGRLPEEKRAFR